MRKAIECSPNKPEIQTLERESNKKAATAQSHILMRERVTHADSFFIWMSPIAKARIEKVKKAIKDTGMSVAMPATVAEMNNIAG